MTPPTKEGIEITEKNVSKILKKDEFKYLTEGDLEILFKEKKRINEEEKLEEIKKTPEGSIQKEIMERAKKGTDHHRTWLQKKTNELIKNKDKTGLEQLNKGIDFTDKGGLIINTPQGPLKFAPKQVTFDDIKDIERIEENKNVWTENKESDKKGLRATFYATELMRNTGKKMCTYKQYIDAANMFPGGDEVGKSNESTKVKDFFDLLGVENNGWRVPNGKWCGKGKNLLSSSAANYGDVYYMEYFDSEDEGGLSKSHGKYGFGVRFLED